MASIRIRGLIKTFGDAAVLRSVDLDVADGEFIVLLGPSGCGKSTLLNAIAGLDAVDGGRIEIDDEDVSEVEPSRRGIAMVFQSYALYPTMTVRRNLSFGLRVKSVPKPEVERRVAWAAGLLHLEPLLDRRPAQLSGGQRQRVAIGRALVQQARVCLFDEPLSNLDAKLRAEMRVELRRLHQSLKQTIVYVTHDQIEALTLATRVAVLNEGRIEQFASPDELYAMPATRFVAGFVGSPSMTFLDGELTPHDDGPGFGFGDIRLPLRSYASVLPLASTGRATLGLRPEHVTLAQAPSPTTVSAMVDLVEPMGSDWLGTFRVGHHRLSARLTPAQGRAIRGTVLLDLDIAAASLFDPITQHRL